MHLTIAIPIYFSDPLHVDFTRQTIDSIHTTHRYATIIVNNYTSKGLQNELKSFAATPKTTIVDNPKGNQLAVAWNIGIKQGIKNNSDYILTINNDIIFHPHAIDNLIRFALKHPDFLLWTASQWADMRTLSKAKWDGSFDYHPHFSCFMINKTTPEKIGFFDENLKGAYFEDNDYHTRILLARKKAAITTTSRFYHYGSRTANVDDNLRALNKKNYQLNRLYMQKKWGLDFHGKGFKPPEKILKEIYSHPFNNPSMTIKDW